MAESSSNNDPRAAFRNLDLEVFQLKDKGLLDDADKLLRKKSSLLKKPHPLVSGYFQELHGIVRHFANDNEGASICAIEASRFYKEGNHGCDFDMFVFPFTCSYLSEWYGKRGESILASRYEEKRTEMVNQMLQLSLGISEDLQEALIRDEQVEKEKADAKAAKVKAKNKAKKEKRKLKKTSDSKLHEEFQEKLQEEEESDEQLEQGEHQQKVGSDEKPKEVEDHEKQRCEEKQKLRFEESFWMEMQEISDGEISDGLVLNKFGAVKRSFLVLPPEAIDKYDELWKLCSSNEFLLSVSHLTHDPRIYCESGRRIEDFPMVIVEDVVTFSDYCTHLLENFSKNYGASWWSFIEDKFIILFSDVIEALLFLYKKKRCCGSLIRNLYVTKDGRGRILPSAISTFGNSQKSLDVSAFESHMKAMILYPFKEDTSLTIHDADLGLPKDLRHLFTFLEDFKLQLPAEYMFDHPYFWSSLRMINYPDKLKKCLYTRPSSLKDFDVALAYFVNWSSRVETYALYHAIWKRGDPTKIPSADDWEVIRNLELVKVAPYTEPHTIVRFFCASLDHANDNYYESLRSKSLKPSEIMEQLLEIFPEFYTHTYGAIGICVANGTMDETIMAELRTT